MNSTMNGETLCIFKMRLSPSQPNSFCFPTQEISSFMENKIKIVGGRAREALGLQFDQNGRK